VSQEQEIKELEDSELESNSEKKALKLLHFETLRTAFLIIFSLILLIAVVPYFFDNSALKFQLEQKVSQSLGTKFTIYGKVRVAFLPVPSLVASDVIFEDYRDKNSEKTYDLYAKALKVQLPLFGVDVLKKVTLSDADLVSYNLDKSLVATDNKILSTINEFKKNKPADAENLDSGLSAKFFNISDVSFNKSSPMPEFVIKNGRVVFYDKFARKKEFSEIDARLKISLGNLAASGSFVSQNMVSNFNLAAVFNSKSSEQDTYFDLVSPALELHLKGNLIAENRGLFKSDFVGKIDAQIMDLKSAYQGYFDSEGVIATRLKSNSKPIKFLAEVNTKNQQITINKIQINSDLINGSGEVAVGLDVEIPMIDVTLNLEEIDLDNIWSNEVVKLGNVSQINNDSAKPTEAEVEVKNEEKSEEKKIDIELSKKVKNFDLNAEISIKKIKYLSGQINDSSIYFSTSGKGDIIVMPAIFKLPGDSNLRLSGVFDNSTAISKFVGDFDVKGKALKEIFSWLKVESQNLKLDALGEYSMHSEVLILPNSVALNNSTLKLGDSEFFGELRFDNDGKALDSSGRIHANKIDIDDYFLISGQNTYLSPGLLLKKVFWLNDLSSNNSFSLSFDKLIYREEEFDSQSFKLRIGRGYIEISGLKLLSPETDLQADLSVDISDQNPRFKLKVEGKKFHYESPESDANVNFFDQFFALPSLENFGGEMTINIDEAKIDDLMIYEAKLSGSMRDGNIEKARLSGDFYGGQFSYQGALGLKVNKTLSGNMSFTGVDLKPFLSDVVGIKNVSGIGNFAANISAISANKNEFANQLKSEIKFNVNAPSVEGYGLSDLIQKMFAAKTFAQDLQNPEKILFNESAKTVFSQASGVIQINNGKDGKLKIDVTGPANNGILSGNFAAKDLTVDLLFNAIFLTGNDKKQIPINIATKLAGKTDDIKQSTNLDQARQYLGLPIAQKPIEKTTVISQ
jgi:uncharacterized protein involved in outer membrane biogenesis